MTEDKIQERLNSESNLLNKLGKGHGLGGNKLNHERAGRKGEENLSPFMREVISSAASLDTAKNTALAFGVSQAHAHNLKHGIVTRPKGKDESLIKGRNKTLEDIHTKASDLVMQTLGLITPEKLKEVEKAKDLTAIAKDLSSVVEKTSPDPNKNRSNTNNILVYAPQMTNLPDFDVIDVEAMEVD
jgi:hypothetical protein